MDKPLRSSFSARARVVDLLGRQQIADAPTAINELLKNAVDAAASSATVSLGLEDASLVISDNGLGMRTQDLVGKWLVLATDSKHSQKPDPEYLRYATPTQRNGLETYPPLGEKGIGRLAVAALGRSVLVWTRWGKGDLSERTLLFIHWKLFEHPRLYLNDIVVPYITYKNSRPTTEDAMRLMHDLIDWINDQSTSMWSSEQEDDIRKTIVNDLSKDGPFYSCIGKCRFDTEPGTTFLILGTVADVEEAFSEENVRGQASRSMADAPVPEGYKTLLGFCDPFGEAPPKARRKLYHRRQRAKGSA